MHRLALSALAALLSVTVLVPAQAARTAAARVVAIGDVHGAADSFAAILTRAGLIDAQQRWAGGNTVLVQTGDMTDRGAGMRAALDLLMALEQQAPKSRGRVIPLLGNHEVMNMVGEMRDVTPEIFATFGGEAAMREAFGPQGQYGKWLRRRSVVGQVDDTVFMHAGINPAFSDVVGPRHQHPGAAGDQGVGRRRGLAEAARAGHRHPAGHGGGQGRAGRAGAAGGLADPRRAGQHVPTSASWSR